MHDDLLERRLRAALHREADDLPFTITTAELERRLALRNRLTAGRRTAWLLAATVAIGLLGVGAMLGGHTDDPPRSPEPSPLAATSKPAPSGRLNMGTLDEFIEGAIGNEVVVAHARDDVDVGGGIDGDALPPTVSVSLGPISGSSAYQVTVVCQGPGNAQLQTFAQGTGAPHIGFEVECDATTYTQPIYDDGPITLYLAAPREANWRVVVRRLDGAGPIPAADPAPLEFEPGEEALVTEENRSVLPGGRPDPDAPGLTLGDLGSLAGRYSYRVQASCVGDTAIRHIVANDVNGTYQAFITTLIPCDGAVHDTFLDVPQPFGAVSYVAATPEARWSILVSSEQPPVAIAEDQPGWQMQVGFGPHLSFDGMEHGFSAPGVEGGGPVLIVFACAGDAPIEVVVDVGRRVGEREETVSADCAPEGAETSQTFELATGQVHLTYTAPVGTWIAITILVPDPLPE